MQNLVKVVGVLGSASRLKIFLWFIYFVKEFSSSFYYFVEICNLEFNAISRNELE